jgi:hypothetical protein
MVVQHAPACQAESRMGRGFRGSGPMRRGNISKPRSGVVSARSMVRRAGRFVAHELRERGLRWAGQQRHGGAAAGPQSLQRLVVASLAAGLLSARAAEAPLVFGWRPGDREVAQGWRALTFRNIAQHTRYTLVRDGDDYVVKAQAEASASGLIRRVDVDAKAYPVLRWRWKVENLLTKADVTRKQGDDYPARIYVAFAYDPKRVGVGQRIKYEAARLIYGEYPPHAGLNYIWEGKAAVGSVVPNPFTERVRMIVVESGAAHLGQWRQYERNVYQDYRAAFGEEPPAIAGVAIMTDTDNTGESAVAYYGAVSLSPVER